MACRCFIDRTSTRPPIPARYLNLDPYGNVKVWRHASVDDAPERFLDWRLDQAHPHPSMKVFNQYWFSRHWTRSWSNEINAVRTPALHQILQERRYFSFTTVLATVAEAEEALEECRTLLDARAGQQATRIVDEDGNRGTSWAS